MDARADSLQVETLAGGGNGNLGLPEDGAGLDVPACPPFVETPSISGIIDRALAYACEGFPVHFRGPTGCGKTTLAVHLAELLGRPMTMVCGDEKISTLDLIGGEDGREEKRTNGTYIHSVLKTEEPLEYRWVDSRLAVACQRGHTLIYDGFNRSPPHANNVLLPVLEERLLIPPSTRGREGCLRVHPDFTAIFTSNPKERTGVHTPQDALLDRMITLDLSHFDRDTEVAITMSRTALPEAHVEAIVDLVRGLRDATEGECDPTVRACIMIGEIMTRQSDDFGDLTFGQVCLDVLTREVNPAGRPDSERRQVLLDLIQTSGWN